MARKKAANRKATADPLGEINNEKLDVHPDAWQLARLCVAIGRPLRGGTIINDECWEDSIGPGEAIPMRYIYNALTLVRQCDLALKYPSVLEECEAEDTGEQAADFRMSNRIIANLRRGFEKLAIQLDGKPWVHHSEVAKFALPGEEWKLERHKIWDVFQNSPWWHFDLATTSDGLIPFEQAQEILVAFQDYTKQFREIRTRKRRQAGAKKSRMKLRKKQAKTT